MSIKTRIIYCLVYKGKTWIEDFIDEDTGEIVHVTRFVRDSLHIMKLSHLPYAKSKKQRVIDVTNYLEDKEPNIRLHDVITSNKYHDILSGEFKKYKNVSPIVLRTTRYVITGVSRNNKRFKPIHTNIPQHYNIWKGSIWEIFKDKRKLVKRIYN